MTTHRMLGALLSLVVGAGCAATPEGRINVAAASPAVLLHYEAELVGGTVCQAQSTAWILCQPGSVTVTPTLSVSGMYRVRARVWEDAAGDEAAKMIISTASTSSSATFPPHLVSSSKPQIFEDLVPLEEGAAVVKISFLNDYYVPSQGADRNLYVDSIEVEGPI